MGVASELCPWLLPEKDLSVFRVLSSICGHLKESLLERPSSFSLAGSSQHWLQPLRVGEQASLFCVGL